MRASRWVRSAALICAAAVAACTASEVPPNTSARIAVAPLNLPGIGFACYDLAVLNDLGQPVWSRGTAAPEGAAQSICSNRFGNGPGGSVAYVGPCDASDNVSTDAGVALNTIVLRLDGLYDATTSLDIGDYQNPCRWPGGCSLAFECIENADVEVVFNLTVMRAATQGFFDVAVNFEDIFCSAKLDCQYDSGPIELLHDPRDPNGGRGQTAVIAFACTNGPGQDQDDTVLHMNPIAVTCGDDPPVFLDPTMGPGNVYTADAPDPDPSDPIWQYASYRGAEALDCGGKPCNKVYWNTAIGFDTTAADCNVTTSATASPPLWRGEYGRRPYVTPASTAYPWISFDVALTGENGGLACDQNPLNETGSGVITEYTDTRVQKFFCYDLHDDETFAWSGLECEPPGGYFTVASPDLHDKLELVAPGYCAPTGDELAMIGRIERWASDSATYYTQPEYGAPQPLVVTFDSPIVRGYFDFALREHYAGMARQPEIFPYLEPTIPFLYETAQITEPCEEIGRMAGLGAALTGIARQPELRQTILDFTSYAGNLAVRDDPMVVVARSESVAAGILATTLKPEMATQLTDDALALLGAHVQPSGLGAEAAAMVSLVAPTAAALDGAARQPEMAQRTINLALLLMRGPVELTGAIGTYTTEALLAAFTSAYEQNPEMRPLLADALFVLGGIAAPAQVPQCYFDRGDALVLWDDILQSANNNDPWTGIAQSYLACDLPEAIAFCPVAFDPADPEGSVNQTELARVLDEIAFLRSWYEDLIVSESMWEQGAISVYQTNVSALDAARASLDVHATCLQGAGPCDAATCNDAMAGLGAQLGCEDVALGYLWLDRYGALYQMKRGTEGQDYVARGPVYQRFLEWLDQTSQRCGALVAGGGS